MFIIFIFYIFVHFNTKYKSIISPFYVMNILIKYIYSKNIYSSKLYCLHFPDLYKNKFTKLQLYFLRLSGFFLFQIQFDQLFQSLNDLSIHHHQSMYSVIVSYSQER